MVTLAREQLPTVWGLNPFDLHARFWASYGVQVVRPGERSELVPQAELYLLIDAEMLVIFRLAPLLDTLSWVDPDLVMLRVSDPRKHGYSERVICDPEGNFVRFQRLYNRADIRTGRIGLTHDREIAAIWQAAADSRAGWRRLRQVVRRPERYAAQVRARVFDAAKPDEIARFTRQLAQYWQRPDATITGISRVADGLWAHQSSNVAASPALRGPLWVGAGRRIDAGQSAIGPAVAWDDPGQRPLNTGIEWVELEYVPDHLRQTTKRATTRPYLVLQRMFDIAFALLAILITLPLYPLIALAIVIEDGFPVFFGHKRETLGGKQFKCWKFRSMRRDAEQLKDELQIKNLSDGPQFFIPDDPRMTRVGRLLRDLQLDELPQFWNVLTGDMAVVGPRPSPFKENQYCPPWREARLSVKPGITGLWQISRTREVGADFQEWIKYDIQYVERQSFRLDLWIIWRTVVLLFNKIAKS